MSYLGNSTSLYDPTRSQPNSPDVLSGNGSQLTFTLTRSVGCSTDIIVLVENVIQQPDYAYSATGNQLIFTAAPGAGTNNIYVIYERVTGLNSTGQIILWADGNNYVYYNYTSKTVGGNSTSFNVNYISGVGLNPISSFCPNPTIEQIINCLKEELSITTDQISVTANEATLDTTGIIVSVSVLVIVCVIFVIGYVIYSRRAKPPRADISLTEYPQTNANYAPISSQSLHYGESPSVPTPPSKSKYDLASERTQRSDTSQIYAAPPNLQEYQSLTKYDLIPSQIQYQLPTYLYGNSPPVDYDQVPNQYGQSPPVVGQYRSDYGSNYGELTLRPPTLSDNIYTPPPPPSQHFGGALTNSIELASFYLSIISFTISAIIYLINTPDDPFYQNSLFSYSIVSILVYGLFKLNLKYATQVGAFALLAGLLARIFLFYDHYYQEHSNYTEPALKLSYLSVISLLTYPIIAHLMK